MQAHKPNYYFSRYLTSLRRFLPSEIIGEHFPGILAVTDGIPWPMVSVFGFEWRLEEDKRGADFLFAANIATGGRDILAGRHPLVCIEIGEIQPEWQAISAFCRHWADPQSALFNGADDVWFEFDINAAAEHRRGPSFFFGPRVGLGDPENSIQRTSLILQEGLSALLYGGTPKGVKLAIDQLLEGLPSHARVFQAGLMLSRPGSPLRICLDNLRPDEIAACANRLRGTDMAGLVAKYIERLQPYVLFIKPSFDVGPNASSRIGLECYCTVPQRPSGPDVWAPLLDHLVADGLCIASRRDVLMNLKPLIRAADCQPEWPQESSTALEALVRRERGVSMQLHHIKLTVDSTHAASAKAYIALQKVWLN